MIHRLFAVRRRPPAPPLPPSFSLTTTTTPALAAGGCCLRTFAVVVSWNDYDGSSNSKDDRLESDSTYHFCNENNNNSTGSSHHDLMLSSTRSRTTTIRMIMNNNATTNRQTSLATEATRVFSSSSTTNSSSSSEQHLSSYVPLDAEAKAHLVKYTHTPQTSVSLQTLMRSGRGEYLNVQNKNTPGTADDDDDQSTTATHRVLIQVAGFLRRELPIRLAHRIKDLDNIPMFRDMHSVNIVKHLYKDSFLRIEQFPSKISDRQTESQFMTLVEDIYEKHAGVLVTMARGAYELRGAIRDGRVQLDSSWRKDASGGEGSEQPPTDCISYEDLDEVHDFLDRFYVARIGIRVLIGHYLALHQPPISNYVGIICSNTSPYDVVSQAIDDATFMCTRKYGDSPEVVISGKKDLTFPYVPTHLHYILLELLKNSMRATMDFHGVDCDHLPPVKVVIADGKANEDVVIKISDEGGGIPRSNMRRIWSYLFTTADPEIQAGMVALKSEDGGPAVDHSIDSPLAGLGYGLPISRAYARYFGGDLSIMSMEGYGTDAFVYLTRLGNTREPLPI